MTDKLDNKGTLQRLLNQAENQLWSDFEKASEFKQRPDIGTAREVPLGKFLEDHLPSRYRISNGEAVDYQGRQTGQIDLMIYDGSTTCPLMALPGGKGVLLPAEALLATIEVKTKFTGNEAIKACQGIKSLHDLSPWGENWVTSRKAGAPATDRLPRVFTSIFAYQTDFSSLDWANKELLRLVDKAAEINLPIGCVDRIAVLNRGLIVPSTRQVAQPSQKGVLGLWFFSLINFLDREVSRRKEFPWARYENRERKIWKSIK